MRVTSLLILTLVLAGTLLAVAPQPGVAARSSAAHPPVLHALSRPAARTGTATFYGDAYQGRTMANGAPFDLHNPTITAASDWPLGTRLRVRRAAGGPWDATLTPAERDRYFGRSIIVTVADHGGFTHALDLSRAAFAQLGRPDEGIIRVDVEPVDAQSVN